MPHAVHVVCLRTKSMFYVHTGHWIGLHGMQGTLSTQDSALLTYCFSPSTGVLLLLLQHGIRIDAGDGKQNRSGKKIPGAWEQNSPARFGTLVLVLVLLLLLLLWVVELVPRIVMIDRRSLWVQGCSRGKKLRRWELWPL